MMRSKSDSSRCIANISTCRGRPRLSHTLADTESQRPPVARRRPTRCPVNYEGGAEAAGQEQARGAAVSKAKRERFAEAMPCTAPAT